MASFDSFEIMALQSSCAAWPWNRGIASGIPSCSVPSRSGFGVQTPVNQCALHCEAETLQTGDAAMYEQLELLALTSQAWFCALGTQGFFRAKRIWKPKCHPIMPRSQIMNMKLWNPQGTVSVRNLKGTVEALRASFLNITLLRTMTNVYWCGIPTVPMSWCPTFVQRSTSVRVTRSRLLLTCPLPGQSKIGNAVQAAHRAWLRKAQENTNTVFIALSHINNFDRELLKWQAKSITAVLIFLEMEGWNNLYHSVLSNWPVHKLQVLLRLPLND